MSVNSRWEMPCGIVVAARDAAAHLGLRRVRFCLRETPGPVRTSWKMASTSSVRSLSVEKLTRPKLSSIELSTEAAMFSSCSSIWSPVLAAVPPAADDVSRDGGEADFIGGIEKISGADQSACRGPEAVRGFRADRPSCRSGAWFRRPSGSGFLAAAEISGLSRRRADRLRRGALLGERPASGSKNRISGFIWASHFAPSGPARRLIGQGDGSVVRREVLFGDALHVVGSHFVDFVDVGKQLSPVAVIGVISRESSCASPALLSSRRIRPARVRVLTRASVASSTFAFSKFVEDSVEFLLVFLHGVAQAGPDRREQIRIFAAGNTGARRRPRARGAYREPGRVYMMLVRPPESTLGHDVEHRIVFVVLIGPVVGDALRWAARAIPPPRASGLPAPARRW